MSLCDCRGRFANDKEMARRRSGAASRDSDEVIHKTHRQACRRINQWFLIFSCKCIAGGNQLLFQFPSQNRFRVSGQGSASSMRFCDCRMNQWCLTSHSILFIRSIPFSSALSNHRVFPDIPCSASCCKTDGRSCTT